MAAPAEAPAAPTPDWPPPLQRAAAPAAKPPDTINGNAKGPSPEGLTAVIQAATPALQACLDASKDVAVGTTRVQISYQVQPDGKTTAVKADGKAPAPALECLKRCFEGLTFPKFEGSPVLGSYPLMYQRVEQQKPQ